MKFLRLLSIVNVLLWYSSIYTHAQVVTSAKQLTEENKNLHNYLRQLNLTISNIRDSLNTQIELSKRLDFETKKWQESVFNVNKTLQTIQKDLSTAQNELHKLKYENEILKDSNVIRMYDISVTKTKDAFMARLKDSNLGFRFEEDTAKKSIRIIKYFDSNTEAWLLFDKNIDALLELELRIASHLYDANRSVVYGSTRLLEKARHSNKQYTFQGDNDKMKLYQEKALHLLETNIYKTTIKSSSLKK